MIKKKKSISNFLFGLWQLFICRIIRFFFTIFSDLKSHGRENLSSSEEPLIFATNHLSEWDAFLLGGFVTIDKHPSYIIIRPMSNYGWRGLKKLLYRDSTLKILGAIASRSGFRNYEKSLQKHINILKEGGNLLIFPQGKLTKEDATIEARGGVSYLSYKTKTSVMPVGISGVSNMNFKDFILRRRRIRVNFGEPVKLWEMLPQDREPKIDDFRYAANRLMQTKVAPLIEKQP